MKRRYRYSLGNYLQGEFNEQLTDFTEEKLVLRIYTPLNGRFGIAGSLGLLYEILADSSRVERRQS
ncbi:MAG: hypothetical protein HKL80_10735 [Acidimicrobiales bacterium]|nr:hypothetical protein [Acidimicrobiales bacterium]